MPSLDVLANDAQIISVIVPGLFGVWAVWRKIDKKQTEHQMFLQLLATKIDNIQKQFGPNGGGLREKVNAMSTKLDKIEERQIVIGDKLSHLQGEFDQHVEEN